MGYFGVFSFHGSKTVSTGEGGMFVTNDANLYEKVLTLSNHGRDRKETRMFWPNVIGFKYKMSNVQAAMGCAQLLRIQELVSKRQVTLKTYRNELLSSVGLTMNPDQIGCENGAWMPTVVLTDIKSSLDFILGNLRNKGIDVRPFFAPISQTGLIPNSNRSLNSAWLANFGMNLPSYQDISSSELDFVISSLKRSLASLAN